MDLLHLVALYQVVEGARCGFAFAFAGGQAVEEVVLVGDLHLVEAHLDFLWADILVVFGEVGMIALRTSGKQIQHPHSVGLVRAEVAMQHNKLVVDRLL